MPGQPRSRCLASGATMHAANSLRSVTHAARLLPFLAALTSVLTACGGGGGGGDSAPATVTAASAASLSNVCVAPRSGTDPATGQPFTDKPGTLAQEKSWVRAHMDETYLWFDEIPTSVSAVNYATPQTYFDALRTPALTASGRPKDQFHFRYDTPFWQALSQSGATAGYGFELVVVKSTPPRDVRVAFTEPNTPATAAGITRGARVLAVDGADAVNGASVDVLNAGVTPAKANETHSFTFQDINGSVRTVTLNSKIIVRTPVQNVKVLATPTGPTGYLLVNDQLASSESQLNSAVTQLTSHPSQHSPAKAARSGRRMSTAARWRPAMA